MSEPVASNQAEAAAAVFIEFGTAAQLGEQLAQGLPGWARRIGLDPDARLEVVVVIGCDRARLEDIKRMAEAAIGGDPVTLLIRRWINERCETRGAVTRSVDLHADFARWAAEQDAPPISVKGFAQRLRLLGIDYSHDSRNRRAGFRLTGKETELSKSYRRDPTIGLTDVLEHWERIIGGRRISAREVIALADERGKRGNGGRLLHPQFREALFRLAFDDHQLGAISARRLGCWLQAAMGNAVDGRQIVKAGFVGGTMLWQLEGLKPSAAEMLAADASGSQAAA